MLNIVVLVSGGGTNLQALIDAECRGEIPHGKITCVISSNPSAYALQRAGQAGIPTQVVDRKQYTDEISFDAALCDALLRQEAGLIVLAGFMSILGELTLNRFENRIINVHPSLIPSFCGRGYYGLRVHKAAIDYGVKLSGATVHFVNQIPDGGAIILQQAVAVRPDDTPEVLQRRIMEQAEWILLPKATALFCAGKIRMVDGKAVIDE